MENLTTKEELIEHLIEQVVELKEEYEFTNNQVHHYYTDSILSRKKDKIRKIVKFIELVGKL